MRSLLIIYCLLIQSILMGQENAVISPANAVTPMPDTITTYRDRATNLVLIPADSLGYKYGTGWEVLPFIGLNALSSACGNIYDSIGTVQVTELLVMVGAKYDLNNDTLMAQVYNLNNGLPNTVLGSGNITTQQLATTGWTSIPVTSGGVVSSAFFAAVDYTSFGGDTIGIVSNDPAANDGQGEGRTLLRSQIGWYAGSNVSFGFGLDCDAMILPVVNWPSSVEDNAQSPLLNIYPNPASEWVYVQASGYKNYSVIVFDLSGRTYTRQLATKGDLLLDVSTWPAGNYYLQYRLEGQSITTSFSVTH